MVYYRVSFLRATAVAIFDVNPDGTLASVTPTSGSERDEYISGVLVEAEEHSSWLSFDQAIAGAKAALGREISQSAGPAQQRWLERRLQSLLQLEEGYLKAGDSVMF